MRQYDMNFVLNNVCAQYHMMQKEIILNCDKASENRACGHILHPITLEVTSQY